MKRTHSISALLFALAVAACGGSGEGNQAAAQDSVKAAPSAAAGQDTAQGAPTAGDVAKAGAPEAALEPDTTDWTGGDPKEGKQVYAVNCATCHGADGKGDGQAAAALNPKPRDFTTGVFYIDADADADTGEPVDLARVIMKGPAAFGGSAQMPAWGETLSRQQVKDVVAYIQSFSTKRRGG